MDSLHLGSQIVTRIEIIFPERFHQTLQSEVISADKCEQICRGGSCCAPQHTPQLEPLSVTVLTKIFNQIYDFGELEVVGRDYADIHLSY